MAAEGFESLDFLRFHSEELPRRLAAGNGALAARAVARLGSLAFRLPGGEAYTYLGRGDRMEVVRGDESADTVLEISQEAWEGLVHDYESGPGLLYGGHLKCRRGHAMKLVMWEPALRAMYTGREIYDPEYAKLKDGVGEPLDPNRIFALSSDAQEMAHFLRTTGYLFVRDVFAPEEIAAFLEEAEVLRGEAVKGDKLSWWGKNARGEEILCRVTRAAAKPHLATIPKDPRLLRLVSLSDETLIHRRLESGEEGVSIIWKNPDMAEGLSDIPWHRDCGMGGHSVMCPILIASVFLTEMNPESGELRMLPGSWQKSCGYMEPDQKDAPRGAGFEARPGDVSLHYGDVMHAAPAPSRSGLDRYRISAVTAYARPDARNHRGSSSYNDVLHQHEDGQIDHLRKVADRS